MEFPGREDIRRRHAGGKVCSVGISTVDGADDGCCFCCRCCLGRFIVSNSCATNSSNELLDEDKWSADFSRFPAPAAADEEVIQKLSLYGGMI